MLVKKFEEQVKRTPGKPAVKTAEETWTYEELNGYANRVARRILAEPGCAAGGAVGLLFEHGVHMIAAILGALKAGKIYVPLSVDYPANRISYMLSDSGASLIVTDSPHAPFAQALAGPLEIPLLAVQPGDKTSGDNDGNPAGKIRKEEIAYILYTSGSTGRPKGVAQTHENADYYNMNWVRVFSITGSDRMTLFSSFCHDGAVQDMYSALHSGACLYPLNMRNRESNFELSRFLIEEEITIWHSVPSLFSYFAGTLTVTSGENFPHLRFILLGGEPVRRHEVELFKKHFPHATLANVYGQTESSVSAICLIGPDQQYKKPLIGTPLAETEIFVIDDEGQPVRTLESGEILVACKHLSPGYWKNPEATENVFDRDDELGRLYWTGDLGRLLVDGSIEFLGRRDLQVKIRGFRVEPGEIESQLLKHDRIKEAAVVVHEDEKGDKYLTAYIVARGADEKEPDPAQLRFFLAEELPDYMVPNFFVFLDKMPLTSNGKIDRKALPAPAALGPGENYTPPSDEVEEKLVDIWSEVLEIRKEVIGMDTNFFQLGGQSLKAFTVISKIHGTLKVKLSLADIFKSPYIRDLAQMVRGTERVEFIELEKVEKKEFYPLSFNQHRLFILHRLTPGSLAYNMPLRLMLTGENDEQTVEKVLKTLAQRHESMRTGLRTVNHEPVQTVAEDIELPFRLVDLSTLAEEKKQQERESIYTALAETPFHLEAFPLFRAALVKLAPGRNEFLFVMHHLITDGWSIDNLRKEFFQLYESYGSGQPVELGPLPFSYRDFCHWHRRQLSPVGENKQENPAAVFWKEKLAGGVPVLQLPSDFSEGSEAAAGAGYQCMIHEELKEKLLELAKKYRTSLFTLMFSVYMMLLSRVSRQQDIGCSVIAAGRDHVSLTGIMGLFVNSILFKTHVDAGETFDAFIRRMNEEVLESFQYQAYPMERVFEELNLRYPEVPVSFNMLNMQDATVGRRMENVESSHIGMAQDVKFDLEPYIAEYENGIGMRWIYRKALFEPVTIEYIVNLYIKMLEFFVQDPTRTLNHHIESAKKQKPVRFKKNDTPAGL